MTLALFSAALLQNSGRCADSTANKTTGNTTDQKATNIPAWLPPAKATDAGLNMSIDWLRHPGDKAQTEAIGYSYLMPLLKDHYAERKDLKVLEIGPLRTTSVAHALAHNTKIYLGLDVNKNAVRVQQEFLDKEGLLNAEAVFGDVYDLPMADASQDIVLAFRCTPLGSIYATRESLLKAYSEIARVLKPTGEFVLYPEPRPEISSFDPLREVFRPVKSFTIPAGPGRDKASQIMFLVKSAQ